MVGPGDYEAKFTSEWVIGFVESLETLVHDRFPELVWRWPVVRGGRSFHAYDLGAEIVFVIHDHAHRVPLSGPGSAVPPPFEDRPPDGVAGNALNEWVASRIEVPDTSVMVAVPAGTPTPRSISDEEWALMSVSWDSQLSSAYYRGLQYLSTTEPPKDARPERRPIVSALYVPHKSFPEPEDLDTPVWRYMSIGKLMDVITTATLWFSRVDLLADALEGSVGAQNPKVREEYAQGPPDLEQELLRRARTRSFVSCWHESAHESAAMWGIYGAGGEAVAIESTFRRLVESIGGERTFHAGRVRYRDYAADVIPTDNMYEPLMHKRASFEFEREIRVLVNGWGDPRPTALGLRVPVNVGSLIEAVHVAPLAPSWFLDVVSDFARRADLTMPIVRSGMDDPAVF